MFIKYFLEKSKYFPDKKHSFRRKLFSDREDPGEGVLKRARIAKNLDDSSKKLIPNFVLPLFDM